MREEHPNQSELPNIPAAFAAGIQAAAAEVSDVAKLSADVVEKGLVREHRPVFIYDKKLAKAKNLNAQRQEKHREKMTEKGLTLAQIPVKIKEEVAAAGGWDLWQTAKNLPQKEVFLDTGKPENEANLELIQLRKECDLKQQTVDDLTAKNANLNEKMAILLKKNSVFPTNKERNFTVLGQKIYEKKGLSGWFIRWIL